MHYMDQFHTAELAMNSELKCFQMLIKLKPKATKSTSWAVLQVSVVSYFDRSFVTSEALSGHFNDEILRDS